MAERLAAWVVTGPVGHLASGLADWAALVRYALGPRVRAWAERAGRRSGR